MATPRGEQTVVEDRAAFTRLLWDTWSPAGWYAEADFIQALEAFDKPFLCCFSDGDPITRGGDALFTSRVPGAHGMAHRTLHGGHFIQEDDPAGFVAAIRDVATATR